MIYISFCMCDLGNPQPNPQMGLRFCRAQVRAQSRGRALKEKPAGICADGLLCPIAEGVAEELFPRPLEHGPQSLRKSFAFATSPCPFRAQRRPLRPLPYYDGFNSPAGYTPVDVDGGQL